MDWKYLYLFLNIGTIVIPLAASFYPKADFSKTWIRLFISIAVPGIVFIAWDIWFTDIGVWGFNPKYLTGVTVFNLPLEELLFFFTIPYACLFTYFSLKHLVPRNPLEKYESAITIGIIILCLLGSAIYHDRAYTFTTLVLTAVLLMFVKLKVKPNYLSHFYFFFAFILVPFFVINGILTGSFIEGEIVWYNNAENSSIRLFTIPVEDTFYAFLLLLSNVIVYEWLKGIFQNKKMKKKLA